MPDQRRGAGRRGAACGLLTAAVALTGCFSPRRGIQVAPVDSGPPITYVAVGASESVGLGAANPVRDAWPQVFYRSALPARATFVDLAISGDTVSDALGDQLPDAEALHPNLVTVWLNVNDLVAGISPAEYGRQLAQLLAGLQAAGATRVLVANVPPVDRLPGLPTAAAGSVVSQLVDQYNAVIAQTVAAARGVLVDLHRIGLAAEADGTFASLVSADGFHPSTAGHAAVAAAFAHALTVAGGP